MSNKYFEVENRINGSQGNKNAAVCLNSRVIKPSGALMLGGIGMIAAGFSGIGYVPGKEMFVTILFAIMMAAGIFMLGIYSRRLKAYRQFIKIKNRSAVKSHNESLRYRNRNTAAGRRKAA